ncbi:MAG TPA: pimeloyl-[acyl-carrier protein] methyl ester esterase [Psychromonas hadalis]|nr:pimeloyl-[acyl-carrier protein] methyl ester esterase [Psychromonas hadalis]
MSIDQVYCKTLINPDATKNLVLLHGWGVNSAVWNPVIAELSKAFNLYLVDFPGFGESLPLEEYTLENVTSEIMKVAPDSAIWCGWSLGGLIATYAAAVYPHKVSKLIQVCSPIKFVQDNDWHGVERDVFEQFKHGIEVNKNKTLVRFMNIQAMGSQSARQDVLLIKKQLHGTKLADECALLAGLDLLNSTDLRQQFSTLKQPCLSLFGQGDTLVPIATSKAMKQLLPGSEQFVFENSSHAPFISEPDVFCATLFDFVFRKQAS